MVDELRAKGGGETLPVTIGDFADVDVEGAYSLIFVISITFFMLTSQDEQVRCFEDSELLDHYFSGWRASEVPERAPR